jgi:hypothetical protein
MHRPEMESEVRNNGHALKAPGTTAEALYLKTLTLQGQSHLLLSFHVLQILSYAADNRNIRIN